MTTRGDGGRGEGVLVKKFGTGSSKILGRLVINFGGWVTRGRLLKGWRTILASRTTVLTEILK